MNYRSQTKNNWVRNFLFVLALLFMLSLFSPFTNAVVYSLSYIHTNIVSIPFVSYFTLKQELVLENLKLKESVDRLTAENADREALSEELLMLKKNVEEKVITLKILERPGFGPYNVLTLENISGEKIEIGEKVYFGNLILGEVNIIKGNIIIATLLSAPGKIVNGSIGASSTIPTEIKGLGGGGFEAFVPFGLDIKVNDPVFTSSLSKPFAFVSSVTNLPEEGFDRVLLSIPLNVNNISFVVIKR